jgi:transposase
MRRGFTGLSGMMQTALQESSFSGQVYIFRGRRGDLIICGSMAMGCVFFRKDSREEDLSGRKRRAGPCP